MSTMVPYTLEIYKVDRRFAAGERLVSIQDFAHSTKDYIETVAEGKRKLGFKVKVFETYVLRKSAMDGREFEERYDTPYSASPRSESYWSN